VPLYGGGFDVFTSIEELLVNQPLILPSSKPGLIKTLLDAPKDVPREILNMKKIHKYKRFSCTLTLLKCFGEGIYKNKEQDYPKD